MKSILLGTTGLRVSELCLGSGLFGRTDWGAGDADSRRIFDAYLDAGGNFLDCANTYAAGHSEELLGQFVKGRRDEVVIATKYTAVLRPDDPNSWGNHRKSLRQALETSLRRLDTDHIDLLWVHAWDRLTPFEEQMRALDDAIAAGKVLYVGSSNTPAWGVAYSNAIAAERRLTPFCAIQNQYNLLERTAENDLLPMAEHLGLTAMAWSPLASGVLAGLYGPNATGRRHGPGAVPAGQVAAAQRLGEIAAAAGVDPVQLALAWFRLRPVPVVPVLGARTLAHLEAALASLDVIVGDDVIRELNAIAPPPPSMPQAFLRSADGLAFFEQGVRDLIATPRGR